MHNRQSLANIKAGVKRAAERAGIEDVSPNVLKRNAITWAKRDGMQLEDTVGYLDSSVETIRKHD